MRGFINRVVKIFISKMRRQPRWLRMPKWLRKFVRIVVLVPHKDPPVDPRFHRLRELVEQEGDMTEVEEHLVGLTVESYGYAIKTQKELRERTTENRVLYGIAILLAMGGAMLYGGLKEQSDKLSTQANTIAIQQIDITKAARNLTLAQREGCERLNIVRANQADVLRDDIAASKRALENLGPLEGFRQQFEIRIEQRRSQLKALKESVEQYPNGHPYHIHCERAYPFPPEVAPNKSAKKAAEKQKKNRRG